MGIRRKITMGFMGLALLLLFAGAISVFELRRLRTQAHSIVEMSLSNMALAQDMRTALEAQNSAMLRMAISDHNVPDESFDAAVENFSGTLQKAAAVSQGSQELQNIYAANTYYHDIIDSHLAEDENKDVNWFINAYLPAYYKLDVAIKDYITSPETSLATRTEMLESSAYKTITPSIITLTVAILIVIIFYFFVDIYFVRPILQMNKGLEGFLYHKIPFAVTFENSGDEMGSLKEMIEELVGRIKKQTPN